MSVSVQCGAASDAGKLARSARLTVRYASREELQLLEAPGEALVAWARNNRLDRVKAVFPAPPASKAGAKAAGKAVSGKAAPGSVSDVDFRNSAGITALLAAATHGHTAVVKVGDMCAILLYAA